ncbi:MAG: TlpA disulfide reductase family protein [Myxococcota bacterium]
MMAWLMGGLAFAEPVDDVPSPAEPLQIVQADLHPAHQRALRLEAIPLGPRTSQWVERGRASTGDLPVVVSKRGVWRMAPGRVYGEPDAPLSRSLTFDPPRLVPAATFVDGALGEVAFSLQGEALMAGWTQPQVTGALEVRGASYACRVIPFRGRLDDARSELHIDQNRDGVFSDTERIDGTVVLETTRYAVAVTQHPARVTLRPLGQGRRRDLEPAPSFHWRDVDGTMRRSEDYLGRYLILDFWGTWCGPCLGDHPRLTELAEQFAGTASVLGVAVDSPRLARWLTKHPLPWPNVSLELNQLDEAWGVDGYPKYVLVDPEGNRVFTGKLPDLEVVLAGIQR